jgi:hypothetical protein
MQSGTKLKLKKDWHYGETYYFRRENYMSDEQWIPNYRTKKIDSDEWVEGYISPSKKGDYLKGCR